MKKPPELGNTSCGRWHVHDVHWNPPVRDVSSSASLQKIPLRWDRQSLPGGSAVRWAANKICFPKNPGMSWGVKTTCFKAPGVSLGGSGVSIGGVRILRVNDSLVARWESPPTFLIDWYSQLVRVRLNSSTFEWPTAGYVFGKRPWYESGYTFWGIDILVGQLLCCSNFFPWPFRGKNRSSFEKLSRTDTSTQKTQSASKTQPVSKW